MKERLMDLIDDFRQMDQPDDNRGWTEHLTDHLLSQGVVVPGVKIGDKLYCVVRGRIVKYTVSSLQFYRDDIIVCASGGIDHDIELCSVNDIGKDYVFRSVEEIKKIPNPRRMVDIDKLELQPAVFTDTKEEIYTIKKKIIDSIPLSDTEEVVRCCDCKHGQVHRNIGVICEYAQDHYKPYKHFCGNGERRDK